MVSSSAEKEAQDHADTEPERVLYDDGCTDRPALRILHFNDVYHPQASEEEPLGGAARFKSLCDHYRHDTKYNEDPTPLTLFSGDVFNPSKESTVTKGSHMVPVLNELGIDAACAGNHEFDWGAAHFAYLAKDCNFPWLLANIFDPELGTKHPMGNCERYRILETSNGLKVGVMGLVEKEWTEKIHSSLPADLEYLEMLDVAKELAPKLRREGADIVIALTHARQARDHAFCESLPDGLVDLVLGGHDHWVEHTKFENGTHLVRSGYDFKNLTYTEAYRENDADRWDFKIVRRNITSQVQEDKRMKELGDEIISDIHRKLEHQIGCTSVPLEARAYQCGTAESNYGNFLADLMCFNSHADCALINGGTFNGDKIYPPGDLLCKDIVNCFPFEDPIVVMKVTGQAIKEALENGVSEYPEQSYKFPQVSHINFSFDAGAPPMQRVREVMVKGEALGLENEYTIATRAHLAAGKAGYESLRGEADGGTAEAIVDDENGILVSTLIRQYFTSLRMVAAFKHFTGREKSHMRSVVDSVDGQFARHSNEEERQDMIRRKVVRKWRRLTGNDVDLERAMLDGEGEFFPGWSRGIAPKAEGRIKILGAQTNGAQANGGQTNGK